MLSVGKYLVTCICNEELHRDGVALRKLGQVSERLTVWVGHGRVKQISSNPPPSGQQRDDPLPPPPQPEEVRFPASSASGQSSSRIPHSHPSRFHWVVSEQDPAFGESQPCCRAGVRPRPFPCHAYEPVAPRRARDGGQTSTRQIVQGAANANGPGSRRIGRVCRPTLVDIDVSNVSILIIEQQHGLFSVPHVGSSLMNTHVGNKVCIDGCWPT